MAPDAVGDVATTLPACSWPPSITPPVPDGAYNLAGVSRAFYACAWTGGGCSYSVAEDGEMPSSACQEACKPSEYVVITGTYLGLGPGVPPDADIIGPDMPAGCTGTLPAFSAAFAKCQSAEGNPSLACCPCP